MKTGSFSPTNHRKKCAIDSPIRLNHFNKNIVIFTWDFLLKDLWFK